MSFVSRSGGMSAPTTGWRKKKYQTGLTAAPRRGLDGDLQLLDTPRADGRVDQPVDAADAVGVVRREELHPEPADTPASRKPVMGSARPRMSRRSYRARDASSFHPAASSRRPPRRARNSAARWW